MTEALLRTIYDDKYELFSAGVNKSNVDPFAVQVVKEIDIDISKQRSKSIKDYKDIIFDIVVTICNYAKENCTYFRGKKTIHNSFENPYDHNDSDEIILENFRRLRDEIKHWIIKTF